MITHLGCWQNTRKACKSLAFGSWFKSFSRVPPTSRVVLLFHGMHGYLHRLCRLVPSRYLIVFWDERRLEIRLRRARGLMGREERKIAWQWAFFPSRHIGTKSATRYFSFFPSHETPRAPQPSNPQSSLIPKNNQIATGYESAGFDGNHNPRAITVWG